MENSNFEINNHPIERSDEIYIQKIYPLLEILKPEDISFSEFEEQIKNDLFDSVKQIQMSKNEPYVDPVETMNQMNDLLHKRLETILTEASDSSSKKEIDSDLIRKAKLVFLYEENDFDIVKNKALEYGQWDDDISGVDIRDIKYYLIGNDKRSRLNNSDIDILMKTKYRKNMSKSDDRYYLGDYGVCESIPKSLIIGLLESHTRKRGSRAVDQGLESARNGTYDKETLEHLIATGNSRNCIENIHKFEGDVLEALLVSGGLDDEDVLNYIVDSNIDNNKKSEYLDLLIKNNNVYFLKDSHKTENFDFKDVDFPYADVAMQTQQLGRDKLPFENVKVEIEKIVQDGNVSFLLSTYETKDYVKDYSKNDYELFRNAIVQNNQEHLVLSFLNNEDKVNYAQKLIANSEEHKLALYIFDFDNNSLDYNIYLSLKEKGYLPYLDNNLSMFQNLPEKEAFGFMDDDEISMFLNNFESFDVPQYFLEDQRVRELSFIEFEKRLNSYNPKGARNISEIITFSQEELDHIIVERIKEEAFMNGRISNTFSIVKEFPHIREQLKEDNIKESSFKHLENYIEKNYFSDVMDILEYFPLPEDKVNDELFVAKVNTFIQDDYTQIKDNDFFGKLEEKIDKVQHISQNFPIKESLLDKKFFDEIKTYQSISKFDLREEYVKYLLTIDNPKESWNSIPALEKEAIEGLENSSRLIKKEMIFAYVSRFINREGQEEKDHFFEKIKDDISLVSRNESVNFSEDVNYYKYILQEVYPERNYNTYKHLDIYEDRSRDLDKFSFNKEGYEMNLSGVLGYKIKEDVSLDESILKEFSTRINSIKEIADQEKLSIFIDTNIEEGKAKTLEGKILEYFSQNGYTRDTMNVLLAYQLSGNYDDFIAGSVDRLSVEEDKVSKDFILLDELVNQYGDNMKETIKLIQEKVATDIDADIFAVDYLNKYKEKYDELAIVTLKDIEKIPAEHLTDKIIQKKILKTIKNTFQGIENVQNKAEYFASLFSIQDLDNLSEVFDKHINELFVVNEDMAIDTSKIEALQSRAFNELQLEISKYEEIKEVDDKRGEVKSQKQRTIKGYFSKNKENAHARMVGDICLANDPNMLKNENYFEFVLFDESRNKCMGTTMLLQMEDSQNDKKYLLYCPNPSVGLVSEVSAKKLYKQLTNQIAHFAKENNFDAILLKKTHGNATNRAGLFQQSLEQSCVKDSSGKEIIYNLNDAHTLSGSYTYKEGLQTVWEK